MTKYVAPTIEIEKIDTSDIILVSKFEVTELKGVDSDGSKSAIFKASQWF